VGDYSLPIQRVTTAQLEHSPESPRIQGGTAMQESSRMA